MKTIKARIGHPEFTYDFPQKKEEILFFDIETTGLSPKTSSIYLIGVLFYEKSTEDFIQVQWFAERNKDEKMVISSFLELLNHYKYLYHFNGRTFDIPYILEKCKRHALLLNDHADKILNDTTGVFSIDILKRVRKLKRFLSLEKCSQKALERFLGIYREDKFSGGDLITVYSEYTQMRLFEPEKAEALEKVLLLHNFEDVEMMLSVCSLLQYEALTCENSPLFSEAALKQMTFETVDGQVSSVCSDTGFDRQPEETLHLSLPAVLPFPMEIKKAVSYPERENTETEKEAAQAILELKKDSLHFQFPLYKGSLKYFFADYKNYYYLPAEDMAVHKSISSFVDSAHREKATKENCYTKREGSFLPSLVPQKRKITEKNAILFLKEYGDRLAYYELPEDYETNLTFWQNFLTEQISIFFAQ